MKRLISNPLNLLLLCKYTNVFCLDLIGSDKPSRLARLIEVESYIMSKLR